MLSIPAYFKLLRELMMVAIRIRYYLRIESCIYLQLVNDKLKIENRKQDYQGVCNIF